MAGQVDYKRLGYTRAEAQSRFDAQSKFCAEGGTLDTSTGQWKKDGKAVPDPAGPFNPSCDKKR
jgi:hypothetical protein